MPVPSSLPSFLRRFALACVVVTLLTAAGIAASNSYEQRKFNESRKIHVPNLVRAEPGQPANYLLIGSDTRQAGDSVFGSPQVTPGQRSDVMMVLHVEPQSRTGLLVSFPRDLVVNIPGHGQGLLNSAYDLGGPNGGPAAVIDTLQSNFPPLRINHYIEVDFKGFRDIVNAIGKIHLWFPTQVHDPYSGLDVNEGPGPHCVSVNGDMALAYVRARHYYIPKNPQNPAPWTWDASDPLNENKYRGGAGWQQDGLADLDRIPRQQYFLRTLSQAALDKTAADPTKLIALLDAVQHSFAHDDTLKFGELKTLIRTFNRLDPAHVDMMTLPVVGITSGRWKYHVQATDAATAVVARLQFFGTPPAPAKKLPPSQVNVRIVNGSGIPGEAQKAIDEFRAAGFHVTGPAQDADRTNFTQTQIRWAPGSNDAGFTVASALQSLNLIETVSRQSTLNADVLVVVGRDYEKLHKFGASAPTTTTAPRAAVTPPPAPPPTVAQPTVDTRYVPVNPKTGGPLVGCPT